MEHDLSATSFMLGQNLSITLKDEDLLLCIRLIGEMSELHPAVIPHMATSDVITRLCAYLERTRDASLQQAVLKCLSSMFISTERTVIDSALSEGILNSLNRLMKLQSSQLTLLILFGLSNIAAGTPDQVRAIRSDYELLRNVIRSTMSTDTKERTESLWVLCNLISSTSADELLNMLKLNEETNGEIDLFYPLCNNLTSLDKGELQLLLQMIKSLERLL